MFRYTRRDFLKTTAATIVSMALPSISSWAATKYTRYNVTSPQGQKMLASYSKGIEAMLKLPADHPQNWFRNAFIHLLDCPHGNWWFYVWHRAYLGYFEQTIRSLSGDDSFTLPYWDWTKLPQIPDGMFDGVLTPTDKTFEPYTGNLALFTSFIKPELTNYWNSLSSDQNTQLNLRGYDSFDKVWNDVTGFDPKISAGISANECFATTCGARYLSRDNHKFDDKTKYDVSEFVINTGLQLPTDFYNPNIYLSFSSSKTPSHHTPPGNSTKFSLLESLPHNIVHNCIGGVGSTDPGPYGYMTNFLSPVDPIFFLHHANIDRLWDIWTRKRKSLNLPYLPSGQDLNAFSNEPFLFFVDGKGKYVGPSKAGDFLSTDVFGYDYAPGFGEKVVSASATPLVANKAASHNKGSISGNVGTVVVPRENIQSHLADTVARPLIVEITLVRPGGLATARVFDVLVNAPPGVKQVSADSPYYAGTISFFGSKMPGMKMSAAATFVVPLPITLHTFQTLGAAENVTMNIRVVPSRGDDEHALSLKAVTVRAL
jgi:tyrosinase